MRILLVEDEKYIARAVGEVLRKEHYAVDLVHDGREGLDFAATGTYDLIVLDVMLPGLDGITLLRQLRAQGIATPVILLTALNATEDKVSGLDAGADDYLPKPFHTEELLARIRALGRRNEGFNDGGILSFADLLFEPRTLNLSCKDCHERMSAKPSQLLELLMVNRHAVVPKETILRKLWGYGADAGDNHVEVQVSLLRKVLTRIGSGVTIRAVRGMGYTLVAGRGTDVDESPLTKGELR